uniref:Uncharacterized protein n=1 Tax=Tetranychus urticae TaxID=32264 RepID=T1KU11_TETUR
MHFRNRTLASGQRKSCLKDYYWLRKKAKEKQNKVKSILLQA